MHSRFFANLSALPLLIFLFTNAANAQSSSKITCEYQPQILELADRIITHRADLRGFTPASFGAEAAYLTLSYSNLTTEQGLALLQKIQSDSLRPPRTLDKLLTVYAITRLGVDRGLSINGTSPLERFINASPDVNRAIILSDGGKSFFDLLDQVKADPDLQARFDPAYAFGLRIPLSIIDQTDSFKLAFAQLAEFRGEPILAGLVLSSRQDVGAYADFLSRHANDERVMNIAGEKTAATYGLSIFFNDRPLELARSLSVAEIYREQIILDIYRAGLFGREYDFFSIFYNQTGRDETATVARNYLAALDAGALTPNYDAERAWLFAFENLIDVLGKQQVFETLSGFTISKSQRHFSDTALQMMEWITAKSAIAPYLSGQTPNLPNRPENLSEGFDWESWTRLASQARISPTDFLETGSLADAKIAVELLYLQGEIKLAIEVAQRNLPLREAFDVFRDFMKRLDLRCAAYTDYPSKAISLGGTTLFRFPATP